MAEIEYMSCRQEHIKYITPQKGDENNKLVYLNPEFRSLIEEHFSLSAWVNSKCIGAAGVITLYGHRAIAWALVSKDAGPHMLQLTRKVRGALDLHPAKRIEMTVIHGYSQGHRWARLLGFGEPEAPLMKKSGFFGDDEALYARVKE